MDDINVTEAAVKPLDTNLMIVLAEVIKQVRADIILPRATDHDV
jgi:hypothetical protein